MNVLCRAQHLLNLNLAKSLLICIAFSVLSACSKVDIETSHSPYNQMASIITIEPETGYTIAREYVGKVVAKQQTNLSFEYSGRIKSILVDTGEYVKQDQVLAAQDTELLLIRALELKAKISQVKAQITLNKANLNRIKTLIPDGYASEQNVDELAAEQAILSANLDGLHANLASLDYQIKKGQLVAPYSGIISERYIAQGDIVASGTPSFKLIKQSQQEISLGIPVEIASLLNTGQELPVTIGTAKLTARIIVIGQSINTINRTIMVRLALSQANERFNGQIAKVEINHQVMKNGYWVPISALTDGIRGQWNVYQTQASEIDNIFIIKAVTVKVLHTTTEKAYISRVSEESINIVSAGLHRYVPGELVRSESTDMQLGTH